MSNVNGDLYIFVSSPFSLLSLALYKMVSLALSLATLRSSRFKNIGSMELRSVTNHIVTHQHKVAIVSFLCYLTFLGKASDSERGILLVRFHFMYTEKKKEMLNLYFSSCCI